MSERHALRVISMSAGAIAPNPKRVVLRGQIVAQGYRHPLGRPLSEDRAILRIASQHIANWRHHGVVGDRW